jgi:ADP-ribose pyrophosphatase YjhB (NUDIX family)
MSEIMKPATELWFDGPNYTADAIIIAETEQKILLIDRIDGGGWALPGGFVNDDESSLAAAIREASEEAAAEVTTGDLVYRGIVDDPRNTEWRWIETDAYLFSLPHATDAHARDDARDAGWFALDDLPHLYASHRAIIDRALDRRRSQQRLLQLPANTTLTAVEGGHMNYVKNMMASADQAIFVKSYIGHDSGDHVAALQKEAAIAGYLRTAGYPYLPAFSHIAGQDFYMEALGPEHGWQWRVPESALDSYVQDCLEAFAALENIPLPADVTDIPSALGVYWEQGWQALNHETLAEFADHIAPLLRPDSQATAKQLMDDVTLLQKAALATPLSDTYVLCHHDARQANIAWHPAQGARLIDWSWADIGRPGSDATMLLIDLHKHGHDITPYLGNINKEHCVALMGFWLEHATQPIGERDPSIRLQQYVSALAAYEVLGACGSGV